MWVVLYIFCFFFIDTRMPLVIHGLATNFFCLRESFLNGACLSMTCLNFAIKSLKLELAISRVRCSIVEMCLNVTFE